MTKSQEKTAVFDKQNHVILIALFFPTMLTLMNSTMLSVAIPTIRDEMGIANDVASWLNIAFSLPFMMFMPLFGRLGDQLGKSRLLVMGVITIGAGSIIVLIANSLPMIFLGRIVQGIGASGITPLSLAILTQRFKGQSQGRAIGMWNATAPASSIVGPVLGGYLVVAFGWRTIFIPVVFISIMAAVVVRNYVPGLKGRPNWEALRTFDWLGVLLFAGMTIFLVFFVSSRAVTGVEPLRDWRLLLTFLLLLIGFVWWERPHQQPFINLRLARNGRFIIASLGASFRMSMMMGISFVLALYLADLYNYEASSIGYVTMAHALILFIFIRIGGNLSDRVSQKKLILIGLSVGTLGMLYFILLPIGLHYIWIIVGTTIHAAGAGLGIASLHRVALNHISEQERGSAAGVYSMMRFGGSMMATAITGVILQTAVTAGYTQHNAYQFAYGYLLILGILGTISTFWLKETG